jgi:transposase-like protein
MIFTTALGQAVDVPDTSDLERIVEYNTISGKESGQNTLPRCGRLSSFFRLPGSERASQRFVCSSAQEWLETQGLV